MARSMKMSETPAPGMNDIYEASPEPRGSRRTTNAAPTSLSPSPAISISSDKENSSTRTANEKARGRAPMESPRRSSPSGKRKRTGDHDISTEPNRRRRTTEVEDNDGESDNYDPDQDIEERRRLRKGLRDLSKKLTDNRSEYMQPTSTGLIDTLRKAKEYSSAIKQTADATLDSRLLVNAADIARKKTLALTLGDTAQGVDVDEFVSKCITYMKRANGVVRDGPRVPNGTQRRRRRMNADDASDSEGDDGEMLNWEHLGRFACLPNNSRPSVPGFLLGPLSVEKRARKVTQRKPGLRPNTLQETRPEVLEAADIEKSENANLTVLCTRILGRLNKVQRETTAAVEAETRDDMTDEEAVALMDRYGISSTGGISLFKFVVNPYSFGQTVENLFYVSFLIRDGKVGIVVDDNGLPFLEPTQPRQRNQMTEHGVSKHQAVLSIDMALWQDLIDVFDITEPMIAHREEVEHGTIQARGWYS